MRADVDSVVIGAGAVGLACAARLSRDARREVVVIDRHEGPGRETTSRNSGVIHAGIYYTPGSLKAVSCVEGRELLYERARRDGVPHRKTGKIIVASSDEEVALLEALRARGDSNGAGALAMIDGRAIARLEPAVRAVMGLVSPESGIVDAHALVRSYEAEARANGALIAYRTELAGIDVEEDGLTLTTRAPDGERFVIRARHVVNAAGLDADRVAEMAGLDPDALGWRLSYCKGDYFMIAPRLGAITQRLVYPVPSHAGLGIHVTMDLGGTYRAGPDTTYVEAPRYDIDERKATLFAAALRRYVPAIRDEDLTPDYAGIRPKLYGPGEPARDFVLDERPPGMIHLVGIESPGLTASESLARRVVARVEARSA